MEFNFICVVPNYNTHYVKALYIVRSKPYNNTKKPNSSPDDQTLGEGRRKPPAEPDSVIGHDRLRREMGERGEERKGKRKRIERDQEQLCNHCHKHRLTIINTM